MPVSLFIAGCSHGLCDCLIVALSVHRSRCFIVGCFGSLYPLIRRFAVQRDLLLARSLAAVRLGTSVIISLLRLRPWHNNIVLLNKAGKLLYGTVISLNLMKPFRDSSWVAIHYETRKYLLILKYQALFFLKGITSLITKESFYALTKLVCLWRLSTTVNISVLTM